MKKKIMLIVVALLCLALLFGCAGQAPIPMVSVDVDIGDEYFRTTVDSIIENFADYEGRTVRIEGIFQVTGNETLYRAVVRRNLTC